MRPILLTLALLAACSTAEQARISQDFAPVLPEPLPEPADRLAQGGIWTPAAPGLFASHRRAARVGDVLTVALQEGFTATNARSVSTARDTSYSPAVPGFMAPLVAVGSLDASGGSAFAGSGSASQSNTLSGQMSVTVVRVLPGGNLEIMGEKRLTLSNGDEFIRLRGIVRPQDISAQNVVQSNRIAQAEIQYVGAGDVTDATRTGWLRRMLTTLEPM